MGISGLLPILKPIQNQKHLSEFAGQTLAVDAYVWLHRGVYACATELAMGKKTTKYVDYAMHRIRLLRHYNIQPYVVFDGGPLPAKVPTEVSRKQRREESLTKGKELVKQKRWKEAREYFVKAVDVGTEMAYQLVKALRAENIPYIVAPYEADAQLAYLERIGLVDGIITEDSDLLVFGCQNVLFKLDAVTSTVTCISKSDFASISTSSGSSISLTSFTPTQFRWMCMLSGCDYLPSIPGIGLKTAYTLLRKYKTVDNVVRAVRLEGKKEVPKGYLEMFKLAEKAFEYQRVWCPIKERLIYLSELAEGEVLDEGVNMYVGGDIDPALAKQVAEGEVCPITLLPMKDTNPETLPRTTNPRPLSPLDINRASKDKGKAKASNGGILSYFAPKPKSAVSSARERDPPANGKGPAMVVGRASGKRTLADVMDQESEAKKKKLKGTTVGEGGRPTIAHSRFFGGSPAIPAPSPIGGPPNAGNLRVEGFEKENIDIEEIDLAIYVDDDIITEESRVDDGVEQEDGYISPSPSMNEDTPELSSPLRPEQSRGGGWDEEDDFDGAEVLSSPIAARTSSAANHSLREVPKSAHLEKGKRVGGLTMMMPLADSVSRSDGCEQNEVGVDLQDIFGDDSADDLSSQIDPDETSPPDNSFSSSNSASTSESSSGPVTPDDHRSLFSPDDDDGQRPHVDFDMDDIDVEECEAKESKVRREIVANGWWERWARGRGDVDCAGQQRPPRKLAPLRRMETTVTPIGRKSKNTLSVSARLPRLTATSGQKSVAASVKSNRTMHSEPRPPRKSLVFFQESAPFGASDRSAMLGEGDAMIGSTSMNPDASEDLGAQARSRLAQFRCRTP